MRPIRTVLVDDAADLRFLVSRALGASGRFEVVGQASDGREGIDVVAATQPDLVVLDLSMPVMDGLEALPGILAAAPDTTVVVLSGHPDTMAADRAFEGGATAYVEKGVSPSILVETLAKAVGAESEDSVARPPVEPPETLAVVGQLAHDLRTPIASAAGFVDLLRRSIEGGSEQSEYAERAAVAVARLSRLVDATVAYAREGHGALDLCPVSLDGVLQTVVHHVETSEPDAARRLRIRTGGLHVQADELALQRVLQNLVSNALTYAEGPVVVTALRTEETVTLTVTDDGPGLSADDLSRLFQPFQRGEGGRSHGGTGLGLALAARLVSQMGGAISGRNRLDRSGAVFEMELRAATVEDLQVLDGDAEGARA